MTTLGAFLEEALRQYRRTLARAVNGLTEEEMWWAPGPESNPIAFILWHVARVEDRWIQRFARDAPELWFQGGWSGRLGLPEQDTGIGYDAGQLARFPRVPSEGIVAYADAVESQTLRYLEELGPHEFESAPPRTPFPELPGAVALFQGYTIAQMFRQLLMEKAQHLGHVAYLRGMQRGLGK